MELFPTMVQHIPPLTAKAALRQLLEIKDGVGNEDDKISLRKTRLSDGNTAKQRLGKVSEGGTEVEND